MIYFSDCPNASKMKLLLDSLKLEYISVNQDLLDHDHQYKGYTSPTLISNSQLIWGWPIDKSSAGCTSNLPSLEQLKSLISQSL